MRESLFNVLVGGRFGDPVTGARVLDLFAGTGALGLEALSRGAASVTFVENGRTAQALIAQNIALTRRAGDATLLRLDATRLPANPGAPCTLVFLDPPYGKALGGAALAAASRSGWIADGALVVWEENAPSPRPGALPCSTPAATATPTSRCCKGRRMTRPDMVIFDCDGVLVDSEPITNALLREDLAARGLTLSQTEIEHRFVGGTMRGVGREAARMGADIPDDWLDLIYAEMHRRLAMGTPLIDGIETVLDRLDAVRIPYCVGSNGSLEKMEITLGQHARLQTRLAGRLYSAFVVGVAKPAPDMFLQAARDHGVLPGRTCVIDDSAAGCEAARRAGMPCLGFAAHDDGARLATTGATVFHHMRDLPGLLGV